MRIHGITYTTFFTSVNSAQPVTNSYLTIMKMHKAIFEFSQIHQLKLDLNVFR
jgi:hypothetical protein